MQDITIWDERTRSTDLYAMLKLERSNPRELIRQGEQVIDFYVQKSKKDFGIDLQQKQWNIRKKVYAMVRNNEANLADELWLDIMELEEMMAPADPKVVPFGRAP